MKSNYERDILYFRALGYTSLQAQVLARIVVEYYRGVWALKDTPAIIQHHINNQRLL